MEECNENYFYTIINSINILSSFIFFLKEQEKNLKDK